MLPHFYVPSTSTNTRGSALQQFNTLLLRLIFAGLLMGAAVCGANGESTGSSSHPPSSQEGAVTPEQARRALEVLEDDSKRAQTIETLRAIAGVMAQMQGSSSANALGPVTKGAKESGTRVDAPVDRVTADSLGAQMLIQVSEWINAASDNVQTAVRTITHFPLLLRWVEETANDPYARDRLFDSAWKLLVVFCFALMLEWLAQRGVRWPMTALENLADGVRRNQRDRAASAGSAPGDGAHLDRTLRLLQRLPLAVARLLLDFIPMVVFAAAGHVLLGTPLGTPVATRLVILALVNAYVICRLIMCITRMLVLPGGQPFRLLELADETAAYIEIWVKRIAVVAVFGIATAEVARLLGLHRTGYTSLVRIVMLIVHLFVVIILLQCRRTVADWIRAPEPRGAFAALRNRLADLWHVAAIFIVMALWVVWAMRVQNGYGLVLQYFLATLAVVVAARLVRIIVLGGLDRIFRINPELAARFPTLEDALVIWEIAKSLIAVWTIYVAKG